MNECVKGYKPNEKITFTVRYNVVKAVLVQLNIGYLQIENPICIVTN